jgi:hypothetical protein
VEDHHVDRPDVEARRRVQLTGTNSSFGLNALISQCPSNISNSIKTSFASYLSFAGLVAFGGVIRPDPIPNSAVKRSSANGTMSQDLGE